MGHHWACRRADKNVGEASFGNYVTGQSDFIVMVLSADMEAFDQFTRRVLLNDDNVSGYTTYVCLDRVKVGLAVVAPTG